MIRISLIFFLALMLGCGDGASVIGQDLAFPGAIGHGRFSAGGRGGRIIEVTNLQATGAGSLNAALEDSSGARVIVFKVGGVALRTNNIGIDNPNVTVLGQTAPTPYIMVGGGIIIRADDVVMQGMYMAITDTSASGLPATGRDNLQIGAAGDHRRIMIDHNNFMYSQDENSATFDSCNSVTWSWNAFGQPLENSGHPNGDHGMNLLVSGEVTDSMSVILNLFVHSTSRNPKVGTDSDAEVINNRVHNWSTRGFLLDSSATVNLVGNHFTKGPDNLGGARQYPIYLNPDLSAPVDNDGRVLYLSGNKDGQFHTTDDGSSNWDMVTPAADSTANKSATAQAAQSGYTAIDVDDLWAYMKDGVGRMHLGVQDSIVIAWKDSVDSDGSGIIDTAPLITADSTNAADYAYMVDSDGDYMWDSFETGFGSDPNVADAFESDGTFEYWQYFQYYTLHGSHFATLVAAESGYGGNRKYPGYEKY